MAETTSELLREYMKSIGTTEEILSQRLAANELSIEQFREDFFRFCLDRGMAVSNYTIFESDDFERLRRVVLSPPAGVDYNEHWNRSAAATAQLAIDELGITPSSTVLDFGCGVGRVARMVVQGAGCRVVGVDLSRSMREAAERYVDSPSFRTVASADFRADPRAAGPFSAAYAALVLQHCNDPDGELRAIREACLPGARLLVVNSRRRFVPMSTGWHDDGIDVHALIGRHFIIEKQTGLAEIPALRIDPATPLTSDEAEHYVLVARVP